MAAAGPRREPARRTLADGRPDGRIERGRRQREQTRRKLIDAACELFAAQGNEPPSIDQIVLRAGVGRGSFYNHFPSREDLFEAVANDIGSAIHLLIEPDLKGIADPAERISLGYRRFVRHLVEQPSRGLMFLRTAPLVHDIDNEAERYNGKLLEEGMRAGRFRRQDVTHWVDLTVGLTLTALRRVLLAKEPLAYIDRTAANLLVALGIEEAEAARIAATPIPGPSFSSGEAH